MTMNYTIQYTKDPDGYTAQVVEWPDVLSCGETFEESRSMIISALKEMIEEYKRENKEIPRAPTDVIIENLEIASVG